jgi:hypothetical protein
MLYINPSDDDTQVLLGLTKDDIFTSDDLVKPTLVEEVRRQGSWSLATVLGYPDNGGITYNTSLLFYTKTLSRTFPVKKKNKQRPIQSPSMLLMMNHNKNILKLARRAILQNAVFGTDIPNDLIYGDGVESITDNIYTYYFNILKQPITDPSKPLMAEDFDTIERERIFARLKPHMQPVYPDLAQLEELSIEQKLNLDKAKITGVSPVDIKRLELMYKKTQSKIKYLAYRMPYVIYLPIYDFQYIKIVPKRNKGDIFMPDVSMNIRDA